MNPSEILKLYSVLFEDEKFKDAISLLKKNKNIIPQKIWNFMMGDCHYELFSFKRAIDYYLVSEIESRGEELNIARSNIGLCYMELNQYELAIEWFLKISGSHFKTNRYYKIKNYKKGALILKKWLKENPQSSDGFWYLGLCLNEMDLHNDALRAFESGAAIDPEDKSFTDAILTEKKWLLRKHTP